MFRWLFLVLTLVPIVELYLLIQLGRATSAPFAIGVVLLTGAAGAYLLRRQGVRTYARIQRELSQGRAPAEAVVDGVLIVAAALLLITPGVLTDVVGFLLLVPPVRRWVRIGLAAWLKAKAVVHVQRYTAAPSTGPMGDASDIIDVEFTRKSPDGADSSGRISSSRGSSAE